MKDAYLCCQHQFHGMIHLILANSFQPFPFQENFSILFSDSKILENSILFNLICKNFLKLEIKSKTKGFCHYIIDTLWKGKKNCRKTDTNSMKLQTFLDSCQIFYHFDNGK